MSVLAKFKKYPDEVQDFDVDFSEWLEGLGNDTAMPNSATIKDLPDGLVINACILNPTTGIVKVWTTGGVPDEIYPLVISIDTNGGRTKEAEISIRVLPYEEMKYVEV